MKKRDEKLSGKQASKSGSKHNKDGLTQEDRDIIKKVKGKKKNQKRQRARETDDFDDLMHTYKQKILKSLGGAAKAPASKGHEFEEVEMSD